MRPDEQLEQIQDAIDLAFGDWYAGLMSDVDVLVEVGHIPPPAFMDGHEPRAATQAELDAWHAVRNELRGLDDLEIVTRLLRPVFAVLEAGVDAHAAEQIATQLLADLAQQWPATKGQMIRVIAAVEVITRAAPKMIDAAISLS